MSTEDNSNGNDSDSAGGSQGAARDLPARSSAFLRALVAHPLDMAQLVDELHRRVNDEDSLIDLMHRASREAVRMITDVHWAGVTAQFAGPPFTAAHTDTRVLIVDEGQYGQGNGPCLEAMRTDRVVTMTSEQVAQQWPILAAAVAEAGVRAFHAEPLHVREQSVGSLNLYSGHPGGLETPDPDVLTVLTEYLDQGLTDFSAAQPGEPDARRLQHLLHTRFLINQAVGMLMARQGISANAAREQLDQDAAEQGRPLADIAHHIVGNSTN
jgi:hypothetical protein